MTNVLERHVTAKVTISLSDDLLARLDAEAAALRTTRSALLQEAAASFLVRAPNDRQDDARRHRVLAAIGNMRAMALRNPRLGVRPLGQAPIEVHGLGGLLDEDVGDGDS
jgi:predicted transcriptional regulator